MRTRIYKIVILFFCDIVEYLECHCERFRINVRVQM